MTDDKHNDQQDDHHGDSQGPAKNGSEGSCSEERRRFLRKAAYTTPTLIALGLMLPSEDADAQCDPPFGCPPSLTP